MARKGKKTGKYQSDKKGDKKVTKNGDECSELQNLSLEKSPKKVKKKVNHRKPHWKGHQNISPALPAKMLRREPAFFFSSSLLPISGTVVFLFSLLQALPSCSSKHLLRSWQCLPPQSPADQGCRCASQSPSC